MCQFGYVIGGQEWDALIHERLVAMYHLRNLSHDVADYTSEPQYTQKYPEQEFPECVGHAQHKHNKCHAVVTTSSSDLSCELRTNTHTHT